MIGRSSHRRSPDSSQHMAPIIAQMRGEVATEAATPDLGLVQQLDTAEDIMGLIDLLASRCPADDRSRNATAKSPFESV